MSYTIKFGTSTWHGASSKWKHPRWHLFIRVAPTVLFVLAIYVWFISAGRWVAWPQTTDLYDQLAKGFDHGQVSLLTQPNPALLSLQNPYRNSNLRKNIPFPFDASLYKGKFYLYFGPAPAIILAGIEALLPINIGDQYIVFTSTSGLFAINILFLLKLWGQFFEDLPAWALSIAILLTGLMSPILWILNTPSVYEAAILSGQFFLMAGLYSAYTFLEKPGAEILRLMLAGIFWTLAIAARITLILPVSFFVITTALLAIRRMPREKRSTLPRRLMALGLPLFMGLIGLGWYNWARFGSPLETGLRYQLTVNNVANRQLFSIYYMLPNLYNYLFNTFQLEKSFPFLVAVAGQNISSLLNNVSSLLNPGIFVSAVETTGIVISTPFILLAFIPLILLAERRPQSKPFELNTPRANKSTPGLLDWLVFSLMGSIVLTLSSLLAYFFETMRYLADFMPNIILLSVLGFWQGLHYLTIRQSKFQSLYSFIAILLATLSCAISFLLAITSEANRFAKFNPALLKAMVIFFER